jgi:hypothetical protein
MLTNYKIYFLSLKGSHEVKYVGLTKLDLKDRLYYHIKNKSKTKNSCWVKKHNDEVEINLLEDNIFTLEEANEKEKYYISLYKCIGADLNNLTNGGDGMVGLPAWNKGLKLSDEYKEKLSIAKKGKKMTQETKDKMSKAKTGVIFSDERKKNISEAKKGKTRTVSEEGKQKMKGRTPWNKGTTLTEEEKEKFKKSHGPGICKCKHHQNIKQENG